MPEHVIVNDVAPRDGLQNQPRVLEPAARLRLIHALLDAGLRHIEVGAFVSPRAVPAMAGVEEIVAALPDIDAEFSALIPNFRGYERARDAGIRSMGLVVAASNSMNERNINMSSATALKMARQVLEQGRRDGLRVQVSIATAWQCPYEGAVAQDAVIRLAEALFDAGASELVIADTIGGAHPAEVRELMQQLAARHGADRLACHFHDTRALGLSNAFAALDAGIRRFDASVGGLGGCPFAPGATGNVATEDLVMMLEMMGYETGIDMARLIEAGQLAGRLTGQATGGRASAWLARNADRFPSPAAAHGN